VHTASDRAEGLLHQGMESERDSDTHPVRQSCRGVPDKVTNRQSYRDGRLNYYREVNDKDVDRQSCRDLVEYRDSSYRDVLDRVVDRQSYGDVCDRQRHKDLSDRQICRDLVDYSVSSYRDVLDRVADGQSYSDLSDRQSCKDSSDRKCERDTEGGRQSYRDPSLLLHTHALLSSDMEKEREREKERGEAERGGGGGGLLLSKSMSTRQKLKAGNTENRTFCTTPPGFCPWK